MATTPRFQLRDLHEAKAAGTLPKFESITEDQLLELYSSPPILDVEVAELFDVSIGQVRYLRKKYNVTTKRVGQHVRETANEKSKARLMSPESADALAIALSHYIYRDGPIEDYHADGKLSNDEMMAQNKYTTNKIAGILYLLKSGQWVAVEYLLSLYMLNGDKWDAPEIDFEEMKVIFGYDPRQ